MKDLHSSIKVSRAISPVVITAGDATLTGEIIDTLDYDSLEFAVASGAVTDGVFTCAVWHDDASNMATEAVCTSAELLGSAPVFTGVTAADDNTVKRVGYRGSKRYVRIKAVQTGATTGGYLTAIAIQGHAHVAPVA